ncbi:MULTISPECIES: PAS domain-containing sensor histidine kinase [Halolamina]|uniref:histidine kinase n=1 Tax=Halolamina pelagica TaxID=699431 RepID=A0A1I5Q0C9_9EURY|nr:MULTISPECIES: PAS domain-containing sensor histidine kinase [Halolamina]NHX35022.1 PAS domain-containing sensor histidine kinase [Halolamina sp. R1-12]SFP39296.1 PAS domain S-box-containing protein [Halolamina pelagica]
MKQSESLGLLLDHTQDKIALLDADGTFTYANQAAERILGFEPCELIGENAFEYIHPADVDEARAAFDRAIERDTLVEETVEYRHRTSDGGWVWLESRMYNLVDDRLDGYVVSSRDVTDRVEAERERMETATRLEEIATVSPDVLWMVDAEWSEVLFVNAAFETVYGMDTETYRADPSTFLDTVHPDDRDDVRDAMARLSAGESVEIEYRVNPEEAYERWVWVQGEPIVRDGEVVRITGFTRDVTERRRRERQLVVMDNLLRHNLRNDLNVILGQADLIDGEQSGPSEHTETIRRVGKQLLETAEKEREVIDLITGQQTSEPIDLRRVVEESVECVRDRHAECVIEVESLEPTVVVSRPELELAVTELLENAIRHSDDDQPRVTVTLRHAGGNAELVVEDDHTPIPSYESDVLTGDHDMTSVYHSSGLGFWLVYWAVELSNGTVSVEAGEERGNRITVSLPRAEE